MNDKFDELAEAQAQSVKRRGDWRSTGGRTCANRSL
jgi:hypothetical protein